MTATIPTNVALPNGRKVPVVPTLLVDENGDPVTTLGGGGGGGTGDASANNQIAVQATAGVDATKAVAVQGITGGKPFSVSQSGSWSIASITGSISLPSGAATEASLSSLSAKLPVTLGAKSSANSLSVVFATDQATLGISAASLPLPTGAATDATISSMSGKLPASIGQKASANSLSVVVASDQTLTVGLPTGASTSSNQSTIIGRLPGALGRVAAANSFSVTLSTEDKASLDAVALSLPTSGTEKAVTANSTPQDIAATNSSRKSFSFQNTSKTGYVWVREGADAGVANGQLLGPGATYIVETKARVSVMVDSGSANCYCYGLEY